MIRPGMLIRHGSFPDRDLRRGSCLGPEETAGTAGSHRAARWIPPAIQTWEQNAGGLVDVHCSCAVGTGRGACSTQVITAADISELQAAKARESCVVTQSQRNKDDITRPSDNVSRIYFCCSLKKKDKSNMFHAHSSRTFFIILTVFYLLLAWQSHSDSNNTVKTSQKAYLSDNRDFWHELLLLKSYFAQA